MLKSLAIKPLKLGNDEPFTGVSSVPPLPSEVVAMPKAFSTNEMSLYPLAKNVRFPVPRPPDDEMDRLSSCSINSGKAHDSKTSGVLYDLL